MKKDSNRLTKTESKIIVEEVGAEEAKANLNNKKRQNQQKLKLKIELLQRDRSLFI